MYNSLTFNFDFLHIYQLLYSPGSSIVYKISNIISFYHVPALPQNMSVIYILFLYKDVQSYRYNYLYQNQIFTAKLWHDVFSFIFYQYSSILTKENI